MKYNELKKYAADCQISADETAFLYITRESEIEKEKEWIYKLSILQSHVDFNVFFINDISELMIHETTVDFILNNRFELKRRLTLKEFSILDTLRNILVDCKSFSDFRKKIKPC